MQVEIKIPPSWLSVTDTLLIRLQSDWVEKCEEINNRKELGSAEIRTIYSYDMYSKDDRKIDMKDG